MDIYVAITIFPSKVTNAKIKPYLYYWQSMAGRNIGIGKISQITGRRDSEGMYFGNTEKWGWCGWSLLLI